MASKGQHSRVPCDVTTKGGGRFRSRAPAAELADAWAEVRRWRIG